jgi:hypothetical protein
MQAILLPYGLTLQKKALVGFGKSAPLRTIEPFHSSSVQRVPRHSGRLVGKQEVIVQASPTGRP